MNPTGAFNAVEKILAEIQLVGLEESLEARVDLLEKARSLYRELKIIVDDIENLAIQSMEGDRKRELEGRGLVEVKSTAKTTWDTDRVVSALALEALDRRSVDEVTGELQNATEAILEALKEVAAISYFRTGKLKEYGIDPDKYRDQTYGRKTLRLI